MTNMSADYRSKTTPRPNQVREFDENRDAPARALFWSMRSGKSKAMIDLAEYLFHKGKITGMVVMAPNGVHDNWLRKEFPVHCSTPYDSHTWSTSNRKAEWHAESMAKVMRRHKQRLRVFSVNSETVYREHAKKALGDFLSAHKGKILFVVDESHDFRTPSSKRFRVARAFAKMCNYKRILTGTSASNSPLALWSQFEILQPGALGFDTFGEFKARYAITRIGRTRSGRAYEQIVGYTDQDDLQQRVSQWASVVLKGDAGIPALLDTSHEFFMTGKQRKLYDKITESFMLEDQILEGGVMLSKLQQISRGWYYKENGEVEYIIKPADNPALQGLYQLCFGVSGKTIVWARHTEELKQIEDLMKRKGVEYVVYKGGMSERGKVEARSAFNEDPDIKVFIGQPKAGGVGLDLSAAEQIVWYSHVFDLIDYEQASERASAAWKEKGVDVVHLMAHNTVDQYIRGAHSRKADIAEEISGLGLKTLIEAQEIC